MTRGRFVILEHDHPHLHWDLMLEEADGLRTWRLPSPEFSNEEMEAVALPPHRKEYLDYEGPVSGGRGVVKRVKAGTFDVDDDWNAIEGTMRLAGDALRIVAWRRDGDRWFFRLV